MTAQSWPQVLLLKMTDVSREALYAPLERAGMAELTIFIVSVTTFYTVSDRTILLIAGMSLQDTIKRKLINN